MYNILITLQRFEDQLCLSPQVMKLEASQLVTTSPI